MSFTEIFRLPRAALRKLGFDVVRAAKAARSADARRLRALKDNQIDVVLDVGAAEGNFGERLRHSGYAGRIISFEPLSASYRKLEAIARRDPEWTAVHTAIGDRDGEASMNVSGRSTSSSLLPMAASHVAAAPDSAYIDLETVSVKRLDTVLPRLVRSDERLYLKIDVQGFEANVLAGAPKMLKATHVVEMEVSTVSLYEGSVLYAQMIQQLDALDFRLISWEDVFSDPRTGYVLQADCIFTRATPGNADTL